MQRTDSAQRHHEVRRNAAALRGFASTECSDKTDEVRVSLAIHMHRDNTGRGRTTYSRLFEVDFFPKKLRDLLEPSLNRLNYRP